MKRLIAALFLLIGSGAAIADPPQALTVDFRFATRTPVVVYRANTRTFDLTVKNNGTVVNLTNYTPVMWWAVSNGAASVVTASCSVVTATAGTFRAVFSSAALNYAPGAYVWGVGLTSNTYTSGAQGPLYIIGDPYASGATPLATSSTNVNISAYNWVGAFPEAALTNVTLATVLARGNNANLASVTNADSYLLRNGGWGLYVFDNTPTKYFTLGDPDNGEIANLYAVGGTLTFSPGLSGYAATYEEDLTYRFWNRTGGGNSLALVGSNAWNYYQTQITNAASISVGATNDRVTITGYTSLSNFIQEVINSQP